jgi:asparagine synthase (glutamine-hydrolysing)
MPPRAIAGVLQLDGAPLDLARFGRIASAPSAAAASTWHGRCVGLASTGGDEGQPWVDPESGCAIAFAGHLHNRRELQSTLSRHARLFASGCDAAYALAACLQWGQRAPAHLVGDFALAFWDPRARSFLIANDPLGTQPIYLVRTPERLAFASTLEQLLADPGQPREVDPDSLLQYLYGDGPSTAARTHYAGIELLPGGHCAIADQRGVHMQRYWHWPERPPEPRARSPEDVEEFRALVVEAVRCRLDGEGPLGIALSGGLDSGAIASMAGFLAGTTGTPMLRGYSMSFDALAACDERRYSTAISQRYGFAHVLVPCDDCCTLARFDEHQPALVEPFLSLYEDAWCKLLARAREDGTRVMFTGDGGDLLLAGSPFHYADWLLQGRWRELARELRSRATVAERSYARAVAPAVFKLLPAALQVRVDPNLGRTPAWCPPHLRREGWGGTSTLSRGRNAWWSELRACVDLVATGRHHAVKDRLLRRFGLEVRQPLLDARLLQFALRAPPDLFYREGTTKAVLREALADVLPPVVRDRRDKISFAPLAHAGFGRYREFLEGLPRDSELALRGVILEAPWQRCARETIRQGTPHRPLWRTFTAEMWLRHLRGRLAWP